MTSGGGLALAELQDVEQAVTKSVELSLGKVTRYTSQAKTTLKWPHKLSATYFKRFLLNALATFQSLRIELSAYYFRRHPQTGLQVREGRVG